MTQTEIFDRNWSETLENLRADPEGSIWIAIGEDAIGGFADETEAQAFCDLATPDIEATIGPGPEWAQGWCKKGVHVRLKQR